jgi:hypothetical protein
MCIAAQHNKHLQPVRFVDLYLAFSETIDTLPYSVYPELEILALIRTGTFPIPNPLMKKEHSPTSEVH